MDIKRMYEMIESLTDYSKKMVDCGTSDGGDVNIAQLSVLVDMIKDLSESMYHRVLTETMLESDTDEIMEMFDRYGDDRRFYDNYRYKTSGKFAPKGKGTYVGRRGYDEPMYHMPLEMYRDYTPEELRDMDRYTRGVMYYTEPLKGEKMAEMPESRYDRAKRMYTETKDTHKAGTAEDKAITLKEGEKMLNVIFDELEEIMQDASPEMRSMVKTKGLARMQKIQ